MRDKGSSSSSSIVVGGEAGDLVAVEEDEVLEEEVTDEVEVGVTPMRLLMDGVGVPGLEPLEEELKVDLRRVVEAVEVTVEAEVARRLRVEVGAVLPRVAVEVGVAVVERRLRADD